MKKLEATLGAVFLAGLITFGVGLHKNNIVTKSVGSCAIGLSAGMFAGNKYRDYTDKKEMMRETIAKSIDYELNYYPNQINN